MERPNSPGNWKATGRMCGGGPGEVGLEGCWDWHDASHASKGCLWQASLKSSKSNELIEKLHPFECPRTLMLGLIRLTTR